MSDAKSRAIAAYISRYGEQPQHIIRAPGRVNIIGEHTDYNDGFVLPCAIDRDTVVAIGSPSNGNTANGNTANGITANGITAYSCDYDGYENFAIADNIIQSPQHWANYIGAMVKYLTKAGYALTPSQMCIAGDVPLGSGLSSSASLEIAVGQALITQSGAAIERQALALIAQEAENQFIGCACGIMDQLISAKAQANHAMLIDCRSLHCDPISIPDDCIIIIVNSGIAHSNSDSAYNERRLQCEAAAQHYGVSALRDIDEKRLNEDRGNLDDVIYRRARHVVSENRRTLAAAAALKSGNMEQLGQFMRQSHISMRDDFEITLPAIDNLADIMNGAIGLCGGARMTGGGFGGCVIALTHKDYAETLINEVKSHYKAPNGDAAIFICQAAMGANKII